jgi:hypothetical protein
MQHDRLFGWHAQGQSFLRTSNGVLVEQNLDGQQSEMPIDAWVLLPTGELIRENVASTVYTFTSRELKWKGPVSWDGFRINNELLSSSSHQNPLDAAGLAGVLI